MRRHELSDEQFKKIERLVDGLGNPVDLILTGRKSMTVYAQILYLMIKMLL